MEKNQFGQLLDGSSQRLQQKSDLRRARTRNLQDFFFFFFAREGEETELRPEKGAAVLGLYPIITRTGNTLT